MLKQLVTVGLLVGAVISSTNSFASRSRVQVLGNGDPLGTLDRGSFYYDDNMNVFHNPAAVNDFKNWAAIEKANGSGATTGGAEGGFVTNLMNWNLGIYGNRGDAVTTSNTNYSSTYITRFKPLDVILGTEMGGMKVGVGATLANYNATNSGNARTLKNNGIDNTARVGVGYGALDFFGHYKFQGKEVVADAVAKSKSYMVAFKYHWGEWTPYFGYRDIDNTDSGGIHAKKHAWVLGLGRTTKLAEGTSLVYNTGIHRDTKAGRNVVPIEMGLEHDLTSWLTARGGFYYGLYARTSNVTESANGLAKLGASIKVGKASLDWSLGGGSASNATYADADSSAFDFSNGMFTNASLTYMW